MQAFPLPNILPAGTQIVAQCELRDNSGAVIALPGAVGKILRYIDTRELYLVRLANGIEALISRADILVRKHLHLPGLASVGQEVLAEFDLYESVIYRCIVGSRAYGLEHDTSDTDRRGIYLPPADLHWSLFGIPEQLERPETEEVYWDIQKFINLALRANPNVLECLYTPLIEFVDPIVQPLLDNRSAFLSKLVYQTYNGYVMSQFKKLEGDLRNRGEIRWKHAMHLIRLLLSGITILKEGFVPVQVSAYRDRLIAIRQGEVRWEKVDEWRLALHREFEAAYSDSRLPEQPDFGRANRLLIEARRSRVS